MIIILDDVLSKDELDKLNEGIIKKISNNNLFNRYLRKWNGIKFCHPLLKIMSKYFPLKWHYRYELWTHKAGQIIPNWHVDRDENLYANTGIVDTTLFGLIYYPLIDPSLKGGELLFKDGTTIMPRSNRMVLFSTGTIFHKVAEYDDGQRLSFIVNIWDKKFLGEV